MDDKGEGEKLEKKSSPLIILRERKKKINSDPISNESRLSWCMNNNEMKRD